MMQNYLEEVGRTRPCTSLVARLLPDFISQPWRKSGEGLGSLLTSQTGNGGLGLYYITESTISGP